MADWSCHQITRLGGKGWEEGKMRKGEKGKVAWVLGCLGAWERVGKGSCIYVSRYLRIKVTDGTWNLELGT